MLEDLDGNRLGRVDLNSPPVSPARPRGIVGRMGIEIQRMPLNMSAMQRSRSEITSRHTYQFRYGTAEGSTETPLMPCVDSSFCADLIDKSIWGVGPTITFEMGGGLSGFMKRKSS